jgi:hypothetical protein
VALRSLRLTFVAPGESAEALRRRAATYFPKRHEISGTDFTALSSKQL